MVPATVHLDHGPTHNAPDSLAFRAGPSSASGTYKPGNGSLVHVEAAPQVGLSGCVGADCHKRFPEEVALLLAHAPSLKYRAALSVAYGCGLRVSEIANPKITDIDSARMLIRVEQGKGRRNRYVMLAPDLLDLLRQWWLVKRPRGWLFPGQQPAQPIKTRQLHRAARPSRAFVLGRFPDAGPQLRRSPCAGRHPETFTILAV